MHCATKVFAMDIQRSEKTKKQVTAIILTGLLAAMTALPVQAQNSGASATEKRVSVIRQIAKGGRDGIASQAQRLEYAPLNANGQRERRSAGSAGAAGASAKTNSNDFWFYEADVVLFNDIDRDGFYHGIDLLFDVDTVYDEVDVYAVVFLSREGGPWNEYAVTDTFWINGATSDDEYVVVTELETGYPTGSYDLLIELYDAVDGTFLTSFGPEDTSELSYFRLRIINEMCAITTKSLSSATVVAVTVSDCCC